MMDRGKKIRRMRVLTLRLSAHLTIMSVIVCLSMAGSSNAHEELENEDTPVVTTRQYNNPNIKNLVYTYTISENSFPTYPLVVKTMQPDLKGTSADLSLPYPTSPSLNIAEFDLNGDDMEEIIAVPIENTEDGNYCGGNYRRCPHYILDTNGDKIRTLGVIRAFAIDRGDEIKNGYWTLKVFMDSRLPENSPQVDIYAYDKNKKTYVKDLK